MTTPTDTEASQTAVSHPDKDADKLAKHKNLLNLHNLEVAAYKGRLERVRELIPLCAGVNIGDQPLTWAVINGHAEVAKELFPHSQLSAQNFNYMLDNVKEGLSPACLKVLMDYIPVYYPQGDFDYNALFVKAAINPNTDILKALLPYVDPTFNNSAALKHALKKRVVNCVEFLLPLSNDDDVSAAWDELWKKFDAECQAQGADPEQVEKYKYSKHPILYPIVQSYRQRSLLNKAMDLGRTDLPHKPQRKL